MDILKSLITSNNLYYRV